MMWNAFFLCGFLVFSKARNDQEKLLNVQHHRRPENLGLLHRQWVGWVCVLGSVCCCQPEWITPAGAQKKFYLTTSKHEVFGDSGRFYDPMTTESRREQLTATACPAPGTEQQHMWILKMNGIPPVTLSAVEIGSTQTHFYSIVARCAVRPHFDKLE